MYTAAASATSQSVIVSQINMITVTHVEITHVMQYYMVYTLHAMLLG